MLTVVALLTAQMFGLAPSEKEAELQSRKVIGESLAVLLSTEIADQRLNGIEEILRSVVGRNENLLSAAVRRDSGSLLAEFGDHDQYWTLGPGERSTIEQVQVPLFTGKDRWGNVELHFTPLGDSGNLFSPGGSFTAVVLFTALAGFFAYLMFLKRSLRELNVDGVIPERVSKALDTLAEGLLILDREGNIVFSNSAFARRTGSTPEELTGKQISRLNWDFGNEDADGRQLPWSCVFEGAAMPSGVTARLTTALNETYTFAVNASPITATANKIRGVLITFDDITDIEIKNEELRRTLVQLNQSQREIQRQNQELQVLATRDPLTGALNRRSLFQGFEGLFAEAREEHENLSCIMVDIDHFKSVNDRFGHAVGDKVIKFLAKVLLDNARPNDLIGRYGGEEFCVILPGADIETGASVAEQMRIAVEKGEGIRFTSEVRITSSFGVSTISNGAATANELVDHADKALYVAKETGRNRVIKWASEQAEDMGGRKLSGSQEKSGDSQKSDTSPPDSLSIVENDPASVESPAAQTKQQSLGGSSVSRVPVSLSGPDQKQTDSEVTQRKEVESGENEMDGRSNRIVLFDRIDQGLKRAQRDKRHIAVLSVDVDTLRRVNDTLGLAVGEKFAKIVVSRLKQALRATDTVSRADADELLFSISRLNSAEIVILLSDLKQTEMITGILQRIFSVLDKPVEVEGDEFYLNTSIGASVSPHDGEDPETLVGNAVGAMREAKKTVGRNNYRFYADEINQRSKQQIRLETELHRALERGELTIYYQPKVDLVTGRVESMEALVRWQHPKLGVVPPNDFIPLAERTGLVEDISRWVIRTASLQIRAWQEAGYGPDTVAVNLSPVDFRNPQLAKEIIAVVEETGISPGALELEITETGVMNNMERAIAILEELVATGVSIALDDFGTGYSSLSYLKRFPLSVVKIDRSFIMDFIEVSSDAAIVSAIIAMSHSLGLKVVAEGVETTEQLRFLQDLNCDLIQGYLISKPMPREEATEFLVRSSGVQRKIKNLIGDRGSWGSSQGIDSAVGMMGVLNEYPERGVDYRTGKGPRVAGGAG